MTLPRRTQLRRKTRLRRGGRLNPVSARRKKRDASYPEARAAVFARAGGRCEVVVNGIRCLSPCQQVHHIGGRRGPNPHRLANLLGCCACHHDEIHAHPAWAYLHGLMTYRNGGAS